MAVHISYSYDIYPRPIKDIMAHRLSLLALLIRHVSRMYGHPNIGTGSIPFRQRAWINYKHTRDHLNPSQSV